MPDLIAQGPRPDHHWRREVPSNLSGIEPVIGRTEADWLTPWDLLISRAHVRLIPQVDDRIRVIALPGTRNPVFYRGKQNNSFTLVIGEHFVIGTTTFTLVKRPGVSNPGNNQEITEHVYAPERLNRSRYRDSDSRIAVLSRLPDLIGGSETDQELFVRVSDVLLRATPSAQAVAIVKDTCVNSANPADDIEVLHYDSRSGIDEAFPVSARLVRAAVSRRENILHLWPSTESRSGPFTASENVDWAFCVPLENDACLGWGIYMSGRNGGSNGVAAEPFNLTVDADQVEDDMKFASLVATTLSSIRQSQQLQHRQAAMRQFFAPVVLRAIAGRDTSEVLRPRIVDLSVMFCDLRGFSRSSEQQSDRLLELLARVSDALGVMTKHILETGGVIGDFHGDAAMGFWGWPLTQPDAPERAATTALRIRDDYAAPRNQHAFRCGIGIASGRGVAGQIGTVDQVKVTAFGPVVNLAARLENMTKTFGTQILLDGETATKLLQSTSENRDWRLRRLAHVRPAGMEFTTDVYELRNDTPEDRTFLSERDIEKYEKSWQLLARSEWAEAYELLHQLPAFDRPKDVLLSLILKHDRVAPANWKGVIEFPIR
jgi:adenylate cyclase